MQHNARGARSQCSVRDVHFFRGSSTPPSSVGLLALGHLGGHVGGINSDHSHTIHSPALNPETGRVTRQLTRPEPAALLQTPGFDCRSAGACACEKRERSERVDLRVGVLRGHTAQGSVVRRRGPPYAVHAKSVTRSVPGRPRQRSSRRLVERAGLTQESGTTFGRLPSTIARVSTHNLRAEAHKFALPLVRVVNDRVRLLDERLGCPVRRGRLQRQFIRRTRARYELERPTAHRA